MSAITNTLNARDALLKAALAYGHRHHDDGVLARKLRRAADDYTEAHDARLRDALR